MSRNYQVHSTHTVEEVLLAINNNQIKFGQHHTASLTCMRMRNFSAHGVSCAKCDVTGETFKVERHRGGREYKSQYSGYHLNLYTEKGILMTMDHIIPRSRGGATTIDNVQPMCTNCNNRKGNMLPGETYQHVSGKRHKASRNLRGKIKVINWRRFFSIRWFSRALKRSIVHMELPQLPKLQIRKRRLRWYHIKVGKWNATRAKNRRLSKRLLLEQTITKELESYEKAN